MPQWVVHDGLAACLNSGVRKMIPGSRETLRFDLVNRLYKLEIHPYCDETTDAASLLFDLH